jgi:prevent-host-death family protein
VTVIYPLAQAQARLAELVSRAQHAREPVMLSEHGTPVAAIVSMADLEDFQRAQDAADLATCQAVKARSGSGIRHEDFMAMLDTEDAALE